MSFSLPIIGINFQKFLCPMKIGQSFFKNLSSKIVCDKFTYLMELALFLKNK